jgi:hypothetical protein
MLPVSMPLAIIWELVSFCASATAAMDFIGWTHSFFF